MHRHYFISDDLDELERVESELEAGGIGTQRIHVLSENDVEVARHHLHDISPLLKKDVVNSGSNGALVGVLLASLLLALAYLSGWTDSAAGWTPFVLLAATLVAFCAWDGGFLGIQHPNRCFLRFQSSLSEGRHVFFVDVDDNQQATLQRVIEHHPLLQMAGTDAATPYWLPTWRQRWQRLKRIDR